MKILEIKNEVVETLDNGIIIDVPVQATTEKDDVRPKQSLTKRLSDNLSKIYDPDIVKTFLEFIIITAIVVTFIFVTYSYFSSDDNRGVTVISKLADDNGKINFPKGWEITPALQKELDSGNISLAEITVYEADGYVSFSGGDSDKITVINYRVEIEDNDPPIYTEKYFDKMVREGKNTYVVKTIGLITEAVVNKGAQ